jgi:peptidoglycan hydrolase CwlO-like protein
MTTLIREEETKYILDNYQSMTPQYLLDYIMGHHNDSDCIHIFNNLPQDLQKTIDDIAAEEVKVKDKMIEEVDKAIENVVKFNKQLDEDIYKLQHQLEITRELNKQLGI